MSEAMEDRAERMVMFGRVPKDQAFSFKIVPLPGRLMRADILGKQITAFARLMKVIGDDIDPNQKFGSYLTGLSLDEEGAVTVSLAVIPVESDAARSTEKEG